MSSRSPSPALAGAGCRFPRWLVGLVSTRPSWAGSWNSCRSPWNPSSVAARASLHRADVIATDHPDELLALDDALTRLAESDPEAAELVKLRYLAGSQSTRRLRRWTSPRGRSTTGGPTRRRISSRRYGEKSRDRPRVSPDRGPEFRRFLARFDRAEEATEFSTRLAVVLLAAGFCGYRAGISDNGNPGLHGFTRIGN
jgi:hypothetical protein